MIPVVFSIKFPVKMQQKDHKASLNNGNNGTNKLNLKLSD